MIGENLVAYRSPSARTLLGLLEWITEAVAEGGLWVPKVPDQMTIVRIQAYNSTCVELETA